MNTIGNDQTDSGQNGRIRQRNMILAIFPPLFFGLFGAAAILVQSLVSTIILWSICSLIIIAGGLYAAIKRLPMWGYTWAASGLMIIALVLKVAAEELDESGRFIISQVGDIGLMALIILAGLVLLIIASMKGWRSAGLVSMAFTSIFGIYTLFSLFNAPFFQLDRALLAIPASLLFALIIYIYLRMHGSGGVALLALTWGITVGILFLAHSTWKNWFSVQGRDTPLIPLIVLCTGFIISGPIIAIIRKPVKKMFSSS
jgi:hypothetical protein